MSYYYSFLIAISLFCAGCSYVSDSNQGGRKADIPKTQNSFVSQDGNSVNIAAVFLSLPDEMLTSSLFGALDIEEKKKILYEKSPEIRDLIVDSVKGYLFFDREVQNQGIITTLSTFMCQDSNLLVVADISKWSEEKVESEALRMMKQTGDGKWEAVRTDSLIPKIYLQDFFSSDITSKLKMPDHNYMPVLCYELMRGGNRIKVFLGEFAFKQEKFLYEPDVDFIELEWRNYRFHKVSTAKIK